MTLLETADLLQNQRHQAVQALPAVIAQRACGGVAFQVGEQVQGPIRPPEAGRRKRLTALFKPHDPLPDPFQSVGKFVIGRRLFVIGR